MSRRVAAAIVLWALALGSVVSAQPAVGDLLDRAGRYVMEYEGSFWLLALDEEYVQWLERPTNPGSNLSRANPGGGMLPGQQLNKRTVKSEYLLVQVGPGRGWLPFRDAIEINGAEQRSQDDRLVRLFRAGRPDAFDVAAEIHDQNKRHDIGNVTRSINIPMLGLMLLHPDIRERFSFKHDGDEVVSGRYVERLTYRETARPTLTKTSRGRDLALTGRVWIEPSTGTVIKTEMIAADPVVRAQVTVSFRRDGELALWVPEKMEEYYKASLALDDIFAVSTFSTPRAFQATGR